MGRNESHADIRAKKCRWAGKLYPAEVLREPIEARVDTRTSAGIAEVPVSETVLSALRSQANHSFSGSVRSSVSLTGFRHYSVLQKQDLVRS